MAKNLIPEIAYMLGVEIWEEFKIKGADTDYNEYTYFFANSGLKVKFDKHPDVSPSTAFAAVPDLLNGDAEVIKLPWKPRKGDDYYTFSFGGLSEEWVVVKQQWDAHPYERALLDKGWVYRTQKEAEAALPKVASKLGVKYKCRRL